MRRLVYTHSACCGNRARCGNKRPSTLAGRATVTLEREGNRLGRKASRRALGSPRFPPALFLRYLKFTNTTCTRENTTPCCITKFRSAIHALQIGRGPPRFGQALMDGMAALPCGRSVCLSRQPLQTTRELRSQVYTDKIRFVHTV